jgi:hypothetical protein
MRIQGFTQIDDNFNKEDLSKLKILNITFTDPAVSNTISGLGLLPQVKYYEALFKCVLEELNLKEDDHIAITSTSLKELIFNLSMISAIQNQQIEFINGQMYYTGPLRTNIHIKDEDFDFELNLDDYDLDELED